MPSVVAGVDVGSAGRVGFATLELHVLTALPAAESDGTALGLVRLESVLGVAVGARELDHGIPGQDADRVDHGILDLVILRSGRARVCGVHDFAVGHVDVRSALAAQDLYGFSHGPVPVNRPL